MTKTEVRCEAAARRAVELSYRLNSVQLDCRSEARHELRRLVRQAQQLAEDLAETEREFLADRSDTRG